MTSELSCIRSEKATLISRVEALTEEVEHLEARAAELKSERDSLNESVSLVDCEREADLKA